MPVEFNEQAANDYIEQRTGQLLIAAAITMQSQYKRNVSTSFPPASKENEYPHFRTGTGREATGYEPEDPRAAGKAKAVRVGWSKAGDHMGILELFRSRKGLRAVAAELATQIGKILGMIPNQ